MIRINLLPHREMRRERRKKDFVGTVVITTLLGGAVVFAGGLFIDQQIENQTVRNEFIKVAISKLDQEIAEINTLEADIRALQERQKAVENLQADRTIPVHIFDELVKLMPEGVFLDTMAQQGMEVKMSGYAQSNERVAELYRNLSDRSDWLEKPQLDSTEEVTLKDDPQPGRGGRVDSRVQDIRRAYKFFINVAIKGRTPADQKGAPGKTAGDTRVPELAAAEQAGSNRGAMR
ncbi:MAG: PilN domain-containing protein [Lautropia sp.]